MDRPSSTSSSEPAAPAGATPKESAVGAILARGPWAALTAGLLLVGLEAAARARFDPRFVAEETYAKYYPAYDYGFSKSPLCWPKDTTMVCQPTPYLDIPRQEFPARKDKDVRRVITIGASVARGDGNRTYSHALANDMRRERVGYRVEPINLAASSIGSTRQLLRLEEALRYAPDLVLIQPSAQNESKDERDLAYSDELHAGLGGLALRSHAVVALKKRFAEEIGAEIPSHGARDATTERDLSPEAWQRNLETLDKNLARMLELAARRKVPVILIGSAENADALGRPRTLEANALIRGHAGPGVEYLDTPAVLAALEATGVARGAMFTRDKVHFTPVGHKAIADALVPLAKKLLRR